MCKSDIKSTSGAVLTSYNSLVKNVFCTDLLSFCLSKSGNINFSTKITTAVWAPPSTFGKHLTLSCIKNLTKPLISNLSVFAVLKQGDTFLTRVSFLIRELCDLFTRLELRGTLFCLVYDVLLC